MKKIMLIFAVFTAMALLFVGCTNPGGPVPEGPPGEEPTDPQVNSIALRIAKTSGETPTPVKPDLLSPGVERIVSANVVAVGGAATTYTITIEDWEDEGGDTFESPATLTSIANSSPLAYTLKVDDDAVVEVDKIRIVATSTDNGAEGVPKTAEWLISVKVDPTEIGVDDWAFVIYNVADAATVASTNTTTELPSVTNGRYVIRNNVSTASADSGVVAGTENVPAILRDSTFVYLNKGFLLDNGNYGMEMRVKIIGNGDGTTTGLPQTSNTAHGFVIGAFKDPESFIVGETDMQFAGIRNTLSGQLSRYGSRSGNTPSSGNLTSTYVGLNMRQHDADPAKVEGFIDQEYIYKISCSAAGVFLVEIYTPDGSKQLAYFSLSGTANVGEYLGNENNFAYLGIAVVQATVEISAIKYFEGDVDWEEEETGTTPMIPVAVKSAAILPEKNPDTVAGINYTDLYMEFPDDGLQLSVVTVPRSAMDYVSTSVAWTEITDTNDAATLSSDGLLEMSGASQVTLQAALSGANIDTTTAGSAIPYKLNIQANLAPVTTVTVAAEAGYTTVVEAGNGTYAGDTLKLTAATDAGARGDGITWEVKAADGTSATTAATIAATGGAGSWDQAFATATLTAANDLDVATTVKVIATSQYGAGGNPVSSTAFEVTVNPWNDVKVYNFNDAIYNTVTGGASGTFRRIGGLDFEGVFGTDNSTQTATIDGYSFGRSLNTNGAAMSSSGSPNGRRVSIPLKGPAKVTLYAWNNNNAIRNAVFNNDRAGVMWNGVLLISGTSSPLYDNTTTAASRVDGLAVILPAADAKTAAAGFFASGKPGDHEVVLWAVGSVMYWGIVVDYNQGGTVVPDPDPDYVWRFSETAKAGVDAILEAAVTAGGVTGPSSGQYTITTNDPVNTIDFGNGLTVTGALSGSATTIRTTQQSAAENAMGGTGSAQEGINIGAGTLLPRITGCIQYGGEVGRNWATLSGISGSFKIKIYYAATGNGGTAGYPTITISGTTTNLIGDLNPIPYAQMTAGIATLTGDDTAMVLGAASTNLRIYGVDVWLLDD